MRADRADELSRALVNGMTPTTVVIVDYDPDWPRRFALLRDGLRARLGDRALRVEHVGSTSVPGLAAKDRVDVCLTVADPDDESAYVSDVVALGWAPSVVEPGHRAFRREQPPDANLHVFGDDSAEVTDYLLFRDWLRAHDDDRRRYEALKRALAARGEWPDINFYADAKGPLIREILAAARTAG